MPDELVTIAFMAVMTILLPGAVTAFAVRKYGELKRFLWTFVLSYVPGVFFIASMLISIRYVPLQGRILLADAVIAFILGIVLPFYRSRQIEHQGLHLAVFAASYLAQFIFLLGALFAFIDPIG
ncbi:MAG: hypothetical protein SVU32_02765 [Candidatus Nanohaloarchaea archaeon]|nr:hypothetical protein [Candidatus Nanohaloarchaea archaeon]